MNLKVLIAGATGAVGRALTPLLVARKHEVAALVRSAASADAARALGALPLAADALDERSVRAAAERFQPDVVVNQLTSLRGMTDLRRFESAFARTNELRTTGNEILLRAARSTGAHRFVAQGYCGWPFQRVGGPVKTEDDPLDPHPPAAFRAAFDALAEMEKAVTEEPALAGVVTRFGTFYGPGSPFAWDGSFVRDVCRRRVPLIGRGTGVFSFIHLTDVARATVAAVEGEARGIFNVVDDDPAPIGVWLPVLAQLLGAKPPWRIPEWPMRLLLPEHLFVLMTSARGGSNAKFKQTFSWAPRYPSWRLGFREIAPRAPSATFFPPP